MRRHRTTARSLILAVLALGLGAGSAGAHPTPRKAAKVPQQLIFPVVGPSTFTNDYGAPRGQGRHAGVDIMAPKRALAVAAEAGTVKLWTTSWRAGCMLYLHGKSGTTYLYIHLNNDRTLRNDNAGGCKSGVAWFPGIENGSKVEAGEPIAYVGDSGDADGISSHLHFEMHPGGREINPYQHLVKAKRLLYAWRPDAPFVLTLQGEVVEVADGSLELEVDLLRRFPGGLKVPFAKEAPTVELAVPPDVVVTDPLGAFLATAQLAQAQAGQEAKVWTQRALNSLDAQLGTPLTLSARKILLAAAP